MSKLSFRARALDPSKPMPIYLAEELPDLPEYSAINRAVPQMPSGMEKEEESVSKMSSKVGMLWIAQWRRKTRFRVPPSCQKLTKPGRQQTVQIDMIFSDFSMKLALNRFGEDRSVGWILSVFRLGWETTGKYALFTSPGTLNTVWRAKNAQFFFYFCLTANHMQAPPAPGEVCFYLPILENNSIIISRKLLCRIKWTLLSWLVGYCLFVFLLW